MTFSFGVDSIIDTSSVPVRCGEQFGVPRVDVPGGVQGLLVQRSGADGLHLAAHGEFAGHADVFVGRIDPRPRTARPRAGPSGSRSEVDDVDPPRRLFGLGDRSHGDDVGVDAEDVGGLSQPLRVADDDRVAEAADGVVEECGHDHLRADACAVAHGDGDDGEGAGIGGCRRHVVVELMCPSVVGGRADCLRAGSPRSRSGCRRHRNCRDG